MKRIISYITGLILLFSYGTEIAFAQGDSTAMFEDLLEHRTGFGRHVTGGKGGNVITLTTNDFNAFANAVEGTGARWVRFAPGVDTITLQRVVNLSSNLTIDGRGANVVFTYKGTHFEFDAVNDSNIIIHNISIIHAGIGDNDGRGLCFYNGTHDIWIDHCTFRDIGDEAVSIGYDETWDPIPADNTGKNFTISYCHWYDTPKALLFGWHSDDPSKDQDQTITVHHCWFDGDRSPNPRLARIPLMRGGKLHFYNNICENWGYAGSDVGNGGQMLIENCWYRDHNQNGGEHAFRTNYAGVEEGRICKRNNHIDVDFENSGSGFICGDVFEARVFYCYDMQEPDDLMHSDVITYAGRSDDPIWITFDDNLPCITGGAPMNIEYPPEMSETTLTIHTASFATCRYDTLPGTAYENMPYTFTSVGDTVHTTGITGLQGSSYNTYYCKCRDNSTGVTNSSDYLLYFYVNGGTVFNPDVSFLGDALNWEPLNDYRWSVVLDYDAHKYMYGIDVSDFEPIAFLDTLQEYSLIKDRTYKDFIFSAKVKTAENFTTQGLSESALVFGWTDKNNYYFMQFSTISYKNKLYQVTNGTIKEIGNTGLVDMHGNGLFDVKLTVQGNTIAVNFQNAQVLQVEEENIPEGRVGVGTTSFLTNWDDINVESLTGVGVETISFHKTKLRCTPTVYGYKIKYDVTAGKYPVILELLDITGKKVATLVNSVMASGTHEADLITSGLPGGLYFIYLNNGSEAEATKLYINL